MISALMGIDMNNKAAKSKSTINNNISDERISFLVSVAKAYYEQNATQQEIAETLNISRSQISRYLDEARELGVVQIHVITPNDRNIRMEKSFYEAFPHLKNIIILPLQNSNIDACRILIGRMTANYLQSIFNNNTRLGIGAGRSVRSAVNWLKPVEYDATVVQIVGSTGYRSQEVDYNELAGAAAKNLNVPVYYLNAPAILGKSSGTAEEFISKNSLLSEIIALSKQCSIYLLGIGSVASNEIYVRSGLLDKEELEDAAGKGAIGNICANFYKVDGSLYETQFDNRVIGVNLNDIKRAEYRIGVAAGDDKVMPIFGALNGEYINVLVTDEETARKVIDLKKEKL